MTIVLEVYLNSNEQQTQFNSITERISPTIFYFTPQYHYHPLTLSHVKFVIYVQLEEYPRYSSNENINFSFIG